MFDEEIYWDEFCEELAEGIRRKINDKEVVETDVRTKRKPVADSCR